jgi:ricin-type beta-trefoil lectin protein
MKTYLRVLLAASISVLLAGQLKAMSGSVAIIGPEVSPYPITVRIRNARDFSKAVDLPGGILSRPVNVQMFTFHGGLNQQWVLSPRTCGFDNVFHELECPFPTNVLAKGFSVTYGPMALDVPNASRESGIRIQTYYRHDGPNQLWMIYKVFGGLYKIMNVASGKFLEAVPSSGAVIQNADNSSYEQLWRIEVVSVGW